MKDLPRPTLTVIIPVYNEARSLLEIVRRVAESPIDKEILIVNDGSTDGTQDILQRLEQSSPPNAHTRWQVFYQERNYGKGAAIRRAIPKATGTITIIQDADLEYDPIEYPALIQPILDGLADVVYGSRFISGTRRVLLFWHAVGNKFLTLMSNIFTNLNLTDMETCYKVFRTELLQSIPIRSNGFGFEPEITAKVAKLRCRIYELPISYSGRTYSEGKKIGFWDAIITLGVILKYSLVDDIYITQTGLRTLRIMEGAGKYNEWLFARCRPFIGQRVLEVGSGVGNITKFLTDKSFVMATDVSESYEEGLRNQFGTFSNVQVGTLDLTREEDVQRLLKVSIDSALAINVIEHIEQDRLAIDNLFRLLPSGGKLIVLVPAHRFLFTPLDTALGHYRRYNRESLEGLLTSTGFRIIHSCYLNALGAIGWFVNGKMLRRTLIPTRQVRLFDFAVPLLSLEKRWPPPFGLSVVAVGEKP